MEGENLQYVLNKTEWLQVYIFLKEKEMELNNGLYSLVVKMERRLFDFLTIEEIESLKKNMDKKS